MNKELMVKELETLLELTNEQGKRIVAALVSELKRPEEVISQRRGEVRDQGESDQHAAEKLGYVKK